MLLLGAATNKNKINVHGTLVADLRHHCHCLACQTFILMASLSLLSFFFSQYIFFVQMRKLFLKSDEREDGFSAVNDKHLLKL